MTGIPLGMCCAHKECFRNVIRPIMSFMRAMPAFVFMIPVIAFFGAGKLVAVVTTMIFGGTPAVGLAVLGLRGMPWHVRKATISFGAGTRRLLFRVDLRLAAPSIRAKFNQTIMPGPMAVTASLVGAKGLGRGRARGSAVRQRRPRHPCEVRNPVLLDDPGPDRPAGEDLIWRLPSWVALPGDRL